MKLFPIPDGPTSYNSCIWYDIGCRVLLVSLIVTAKSVTYNGNWSALTTDLLMSNQHITLDSES